MECCQLVSSIGESSKSDGRIEATAEKGNFIGHDRVGTEVDARIQKLFNQKSKPVGFDEVGDLVAEFEVVDNLLYVG